MYKIQILNNKLEKISELELTFEELEDITNLKMDRIEQLIRGKCILQSEFATIKFN